MTDTRKYRTQPHVVEMLRGEGFGVRQARIGSAIAMCEAPAANVDEPTADFSLVGDQELANSTWGFSYGGFQVRSLRSEKGKGTYRDEEELIRPKFNAWAARQIWLQRGWLPWTTYTSGQYKAYLQDLFPPPENVHIVTAGQSLSTIAPLYDMTWQELARINNLHEPYRIGIGDELFYVDPD